MSFKVIVGIIVLIVLGLFMRAIGLESDKDTEELEYDKDKGPQILDESDFDD